jgi:hypothetical protein
MGIARELVAGGVLMFLAASAPALGADPLPAEEIVRREQEAFLRAGRDFRASVSMRLVDKDGRERKRDLTMLRINAGEGSNQKYYLYFHAPADVRGTAFLVWKYAEKDDDRWLFIPAIKLVTRVAAKDSQSSFVGSDFSYEDISGRDLGADSYKLVSEETREGRDCYVVEGVPKSKAAFARKVSWIDKESFLPVREEYYDVQNQLTKVFTVEEVQEIGGHPTAVRRTMRDVKREHYTEVVFGEIAYDSGLEDELFSERYLHRPPEQWIK